MTTRLVHCTDCGRTQPQTEFIAGRWSQPCCLHCSSGRLITSDGDPAGDGRPADTKLAFEGMVRGPMGGARPGRRRAW